jgi:hypothetical protein
MIRNVFGIHTDINGMNIELLRRSALIKVLFEPRDAQVVKGWMWAAPSNAYWLYRSNIDLDNSDPRLMGELQLRYLAIGEADYNAAYVLGQWYAEWNASWVKPNGMEYFFIESGPNEMNDSSQRAVGYLLGFVERCIELGILPAAGMHSFGLPAVTKFNGFNGWRPFAPVFRAIDRANAGQSKPEAAWQYHEYAMAGDMMASRDHAIGRYLLNEEYSGPRMIGELGYADYNKPPTTEIMMSQIQAAMAYYGADDRLMGTAWYDIRNHTDHQYNYCYADMCVALDTADRSNPSAPKSFPTLPITVRSGGIIEVPPPDPDPAVVPAGTVAVKTKSPSGQNIRAHPSLIAPIAASLEAGEIAYTSANEAPTIGQDKSWVYIKAPGGEGWAAAWLLEAA